MIYLYAIIEPGAAVPPCAGLDDAPVQLARSTDVCGLYSEHERLEPDPQPQALWRHEQVVETAMEAAPTLPVRFGTTFPDEDALSATLEREGRRLRDQLERVRGCVELAVRVGLDGGREPAPIDGRSYIETKLARRRKQQAIVRETLAPLNQLALRTRSEQARSRGEICASYLVQRGSVERFAEKVRVLADRNPELRLSCTGPWPPYSFVELEEAA